MSSPIAIILAAGKGTRMKSSMAKVIHPLVGKPMVSWVVDTVRAAGIQGAVVVAGHQAERVSALFEGDEAIRIAVQEEQLGTGHAVKVALSDLPHGAEEVLILCGDTPLLQSDTLERLVCAHRKSHAAVTVLTACCDDPTGYGRVVRDGEGLVQAIVEQKDATPEQAEIREINSGIYCMDRAFLERYISCLQPQNAQGEYYLTDMVALAVHHGLACVALCCEDVEETLGVNDREQLAYAARVLRSRINQRLMRDGVTMIDPLCTYVDASVVIGQDTILYPGCQIMGSTVIGTGCIIEGYVQIVNSALGDNVQVKMGTVITEACCGDHVAIGPMAHLRPKSHLGEHVKIGNFVETKNARLGAGSKASHLSYLGDAEIGTDVNIGCGTITCNYDGVRKHTTVIGDNVFVGSDVQLVAPVTIAHDTIIAAGTTVTKDAPANSLVIARVPQVNKEGWKRKN